MAVSSLSGRVNDLELLQTRNGLVLRKRPVYKKANSARQNDATLRMKKVCSVWQSLSREQGAAWDAYARTLVKVDPFSGVEFAPTGFNAFVGLATKFLQVSPSGSIPTSPSASSFDGDDVRVFAFSIPGKIRFEADKANEVGVTTELLVQRLRNAKAKATATYPSQGFVGFSSGHLSQDVPVELGWYSVAYRFVRVSTGQQTAIVVLGEIEVVG